MRWVKENLIIIIPIIFIIIFGFLYLFEINNRSITIASDGASVTPISPASESAVPAEDTMIKVHVAGEVIRPGVYELDKGSRIEDAIQMAGGFTSEANPDRINLAAFAVDAQQITVPGHSSTAEVDKYNDSPQNEKININTANAQELMALPGIGTVTAAAIIEYREKNGVFTAIEEIKNVRRIGEKTFEQLMDLICVN